MTPITASLSTAPPEHRRRLEILMTFHSKPSLSSRKPFKCAGPTSLPLADPDDMTSGRLQQGVVPLANLYPLWQSSTSRLFSVTNWRLSLERAWLKRWKKSTPLSVPVSVSVPHPHTPSPSHKARTIDVIPCPWKSPSLAGDDLDAKRAYSNSRFGTMRY